MNPALRFLGRVEYWPEMRNGIINFTDWLLITALALCFGAWASSAERGQGSGADGAVRQLQPMEVQLRGKVVCLPEEMHRIYQTDLPTNHEHFYGFRATNSVYYTLLRTGLSEALFADNRLREKELLLSGRILPKTQIFDVTGMRSVRNGVVHDLYYYCELCAIKTAAPGPCMCCQAPVELVEKPLASSAE